MDILNSARLLKVSEVAELLSLRPIRVYALVRAGTLPAIHLGRQLRFLPDALRRFLEDGGKALPGGWKAEA